MTTTLERSTAVPDRETTARRLLKTSAEHSHDPLTEIDWDAAPIPGRHYAPTHRGSLYGTPLWEGLSEDQRIELIKHEFASYMSVGIWFELVLMEMLVRHAYERDPLSAHVQYALTEIADECRHSIMFGKAIEKFGARAYGPGKLAHVLGRGFAKRSRGPLMFAATLYVEEVLDVFQRELMKDESLQPVARDVARIHVIEEARHIKYARAEIIRSYSRLGPIARAYTTLVYGIATTIATRRLVHPDVYAAVGLDPKAAAKVARKNPHWRETRRWSASKIVRFSVEQGLVGPIGKFLWRRLGLLPLADAPVETKASAA
jgi:para-aminobenzoate N-oxygenase AurF